MFPFDCYNRKLLSHTTRKSIFAFHYKGYWFDEIYFIWIFKKKIDISFFLFFFFTSLHFQKIVSTSLFYITVIYFHFKCTKCPVTCGWQYSRIIAFQPWYHLHIPLYCRSIILFTGIKAYRGVINELSFTVHRFLRLLSNLPLPSLKFCNVIRKNLNCEENRFFPSFLPSSIQPISDIHSKRLF